MLKIQVTYIDPKLNKKIKDFVYKEKSKFKKDLNNVKALTSGFNPKYKFFDELYNFSYKYLKRHISHELQKSCWWVNYYSKSDSCNPHNHDPEILSAIVIVKSSSQNPLYFVDGNNEYDVDEEDGMILFFDSRYIHGVRACNEERITCALDFIPKSKEENRKWMN